MLLDEGVTQYFICTVDNMVAISGAVSLFYCSLDCCCSFVFGLVGVCTHELVNVDSSLFYICFGSYLRS